MLAWRGLFVGEAPGFLAGGGGVEVSLGGWWWVLAIGLEGVMGHYIAVRCEV
jgi:hypothetical protein